MKTLNALVAFGMIAFATNEASAQVGGVGPKPIAASSLTGGKEVKAYPYNHEYFSQTVITRLSGYSSYYGFSKVKDEIVSQINVIKDLENISDNQNLIDEKIHLTKERMLWLVENVMTIHDELSSALKGNQILPYMLRYPLADVEYRILLRRAQAAVGADIRDPFEKKYREGKAQDKLQLDILNDLIKYYEFYLYFSGAVVRDISEVCRMKNRVC